MKDLEGSAIEKALPVRPSFRRSSLCGISTSRREVVERNILTHSV